MNVATHGEFSHLVTATVPLTEGACEIFFYLFYKVTKTLSLV